jgi:hypothetical protein
MNLNHFEFPSHRINLNQTARQHAGNEVRVDGGGGGGGGANDGGTHPVLG